MSSSFNECVSDEAPSGCKLLVSSIAYENQETQWQIECEIDGLHFPVLWPHEVVSTLIEDKVLVGGDAFLNLTNATLHHGQVFPPKDWAIKRHQKRVLSTVVGQRSLLVVRVVAPDASTTASVEELSDAVFGTNGDRANLVTQFAACSNKQLTFTASNVTHAINGVITVSIQQNVKGIVNHVVRNAITKALENTLGSKPPYADHVMYCIPPGTTSGWLAYGYMNNWLTVYNDNWCTFLSVQMHEIGHNLGLAHANENKQKYQDQSGYVSAIRANLISQSPFSHPSC